jgi:hypothetical protein
VKIETTWKDLNRMPWDAIFRCAEEYRLGSPSHNNLYYTKYMLETWGIDHSDNHVRIVDQQKYTMFLLRWG